MKRFPGMGHLAALSLLLLICRCPANADDILLQVHDIPEHGLVVSHVDLTAATQWCKISEFAPGTVRATDINGRDVPCQFVPDPDGEGKPHAGGTFVLKLAPDSDGQLRLSFDGKRPASEPAFDGTVRTKNYEVTQTPEKLGGFPSSIKFKLSGKVFDSLRWHDRTHHKELGGYRLIDDKAAKVEQVATGPLCTVVRVSGRYMRGADQPASKPWAVYQWFYFHDTPLVYVTSLQQQQEPFAWSEWHFLELIYPDDSFTKWAGAAPESEGSVAGTNKSTHYSQWATLLDEPNAIGMLRSGNLLIYDGRGGYGTYLHAFGSLAWAGFSETQRTLAAWLWIGCADDPASAVAKAAEVLPTDAHISITVESVDNRLAEKEKQIEQLDANAARSAWWQFSAASQLEAQGRYGEAVAALEGQLPKEWISLAAGDLALTLERTGDGLRLLQLADLARRQQLLAAKPLPLFQATVRHGETKEEVSLAADAGWKQIDVNSGDGDSMILEWKSPVDERLAGLTIRATALPDKASNRITWDLQVENVPKPWGVWRTIFPQVSLAQPGPEAEVFYPRGAGEVKSGVWAEAFRFSGTYPSGWMSMPFLAAYDCRTGTGLYAAIHDPFGSTKDLVAASRPADRAVDFSFDHPAPNMGQPGVGFDLEGSAVWPTASRQLVRRLDHLSRLGSQGSPMVSRAWPEGAGRYAAMDA